MRKIFICLLILSIALVSCFVYVQRIDSTIYTYENYTYTLNSDNTVNLIKYEFADNENILVVPYLIDGKEIKCLKQHAFDCGNVTEIIISNTYQQIESCAFFNCSNVEYLSYPADQNASKPFADLTGLESLNITFGESGFMIDYNMEKLTPWSDSNESISNISISEGVRYLSNYCFAEMTNLKTVTLAESIEAIGKYCFYNDKNIIALNLPANLSSLGDGCLNSDDYSATSYSLVIPESVQYLGDNVFNRSLNYYVYKDSASYTYLSESEIPFQTIDLSFTEDISTIQLASELDLKLKDFPSGFYEESSYYSSDPGIVSIDEYGHLFANKTGNAVITILTDTGKSETEVNVIYGDNKYETQYILLNTSDSFTIDCSAFTSLTGSNKITYESENPNIVTVDENGVVKAVGNGYGKIYLMDESHNKALYLVEVRTLMKSISIKSRSITLQKGTTYTLDYTVTPANCSNSSLTFSCSDSNVAKVNSQGKITALSNGTATITIKSNDGSNLSVSISVQVTSKTIQVDTNTIALMVGKTFRLNSSQENLVYQSDDTSIAKVDSNGVITGIKSGTTTIEVTNTAKTAYAAVNVTVYKASYYGIDISRWNGNYLTSENFVKAKNDSIDFVYLRCSIGDETEDINFEKNYLSARNANLLVGAYHYLLATNAEEAKKEAEFTLTCLQGKKFEFPIMVDIEDQSQKYLDAVKWNSIVDAYCSVLEANGYYCIVYSYASMLNRSNQKHDCWVAQWNVASPFTYRGKYTIWQFTSYGKVNGFSGYVDMDICFYDYPNFIKNNHYNGF